MASIVRDCCVVALAVVCCGVARSADEEWDENAVRAIIVKAADVLEKTPSPRPPQIKEAGDYLETIAPLLRAGKPALPALRRVARSEKYPPLETRLAEILIARIEYPERFEKIAPYLVPTATSSPWDRYVPAVRSGASRWLPPLKPLTADLVHPDDRAHWKACWDKFQALRESNEGRLAKVSSPEEGRALYEKMSGEAMRLHQETMKKLRDSKVALPIPGQLWPRLDPAYQLAWEEGMLRPVPWASRRQLVFYAHLLGDPKVVATLGEVYRQATVQQFDPQSQDPTGASAGRSTVLDDMGLLLQPRENLSIFAHALQKVKVDAALNAIRSDVGRWVENQPKYADALEALKKDPACMAEYSLLEKAIAQFDKQRKEKPPAKPRDDDKEK
jgi:hypothetical protein